MNTPDGRIIDHLCVSCGRPVTDGEIEHRHNSTTDDTNATVQLSDCAQELADARAALDEIREFARSLMMPVGLTDEQIADTGGVIVRVATGVLGR